MLGLMLKILPDFPSSFMLNTMPFTPQLSYTSPILYFAGAAFASFGVSGMSLCIVLSNSVSSCLFRFAYVVSVRAYLPIPSSSVLHRLVGFWRSL